MGTNPPSRWAVSALVAAAVALVAARIGAVFTEAFNWDELAFMYRVERSIGLGALVSGGRPGLGVLALWPLVEGCTDEVAVLHSARLIWTAATSAYLAGVYALIRQALASVGRPRDHVTPALGVALLVLAPVVYRWSLQVRTDQLALALAVWGGVAVLASRHRVWLAVIAGVLWGLGFLVSQKAVYAAALGGGFAALELLQTRPVPLRRGLLRAGLLVASAVAPVAAFYAALPEPTAETHAVALPAVGASLSGGLTTFAWYREAFGYTTHLAILQRLPLHGLLLVLCVGAGGFVVIRRREHAREAALGLTAILLGVAVGLFHAGTFAYFWITLGLFLAVGIALCFGAMLELLASERLRRVVAGVVWVVLGVSGSTAVVETLTDTQRPQRDAYAFVTHAFAPGDVGFQPEGGLFCRGDGPPIESYMLETVLRRFGGGRAAEGAAALEQEFRARPVKYILGSQAMLALPFPKRVRRFWSEHYVVYHGPVLVPGRVLRGAAGTATTIDIIVPGRYRWVVAPGSGPIEFALDGRNVPASQPVELAVGTHEVVLTAQTRQALLVWDTGRPPRPDPKLTFYSRRQQDEIAWARDAEL